MDNIYGSWGNGVEAYLRQDYATAERAFKNSSPSSKICFNLGMTLMVQFKFEEAVKAFDKALEFDDWMAISYFQRGVAYFMMGRYDEAIQSWDETLTNIRHGEVVDYDSLHLSYLLCKSEVVLNKAIGYYYAEMVDECNLMLDEARRFTIVKDEVALIAIQMVEGAEVFPCSVDDTILFNPPKIPQAVVDAMKRMNGMDSRSTPSPPIYSSSPPTTINSPTLSNSQGLSSSTGSNNSPRLAPPARSAPQVPGLKKVGSPSISPASTNGTTSPRNGGGPPPPPPPAAKPSPKKGFAKGGPKKAAPRTAPPPPARPSASSTVSSTPIVFSAPTISFAPTASTSPVVGSGGPPPPPPPIPSGGIPKRAIPSSQSSSPRGLPSTPESTSRHPPGFNPIGADALQAALHKRAANKPTLSPPSVPSSPSVPIPVRPGVPKASHSASSSPASAKWGSLKSTGASSLSPTNSPGVPSFPVRAAPSLSLSGGNTPIGGNTSIMTTNKPATGGAFSFKILAEHGARKKKIEALISTPAELRTLIVEQFEVPATTVVEYFDADFNEFVELDNAVNLSSLPNMVKVKLT